MVAEDSQALREFGSRVREQRRRRGLSQEGLAEQAGLHRTYIGSVERGERNISLVNILVLAEALDVDAGELVTDLTLYASPLFCRRSASPSARYVRRSRQGHPLRR